MSIRIRYPSMLAVLLALALAAGCADEHAGPASMARPAITGVTVRAVTPVDVARTHEATGTVKSMSTSVVSARVMGTVTQVFVKEGDRVRAGQRLMQIDDRDLRSRVSAAEQGQNEALKALASAMEQRDLAERTWQRYKELYAEQALSRQELDTIETRKKVAEHELERVRAMVGRAQAGLEEARLYLGFATVTSPVDGVVSEKRTDAGSMASPGAPLMVIESTGAYHVEVALDEKLLGVVSVGRHVGVELTSLGLNLEGEVIEVVPTVDPRTRSFTVKVGVKHTGLGSGQYAKVTFMAGAREVMRVPASAMVMRGQLTGVYVVDGAGVATYRIVRSGSERGGLVEIISGLRAGERIIVEGAVNAVDGGVVANATGPDAE
jgi:RND family efflux transporter MFP subunit